MHTGDNEVVRDYPEGNQAQHTTSRSRAYVRAHLRQTLQRLRSRGVLVDQELAQRGGEPGCPFFVLVDTITARRGEQSLWLRLRFMQRL